VATPYKTAVLADTPTSYWRLDDTGATVVDLQGAHNGTESGNTENVAGLLAQDLNGAVLIGASGSITIPNSATFDPTADFTIECVVHTPGSLPGSYVSLVDNHDGAAQAAGFLVYHDPTHKLLFQFGNATAATSSLTFSAGTTYHIAAVYNSFTHGVTVYVNGLVWIGTTLARAGTATTKQLCIGVDTTGSSIANGFTIDEVAFYPAQLSAAQVAAHYLASITPPITDAYSTVVRSDSPVWYQRLGEKVTSGFTADKSGNGHIGTVNGAFLLGEPGLIARSVDTCGKGDANVADYLNVGDIDIVGSAITVEAWIKCAATPSAAMTIVGKHNSATDVQGSLSVTAAGKLSFAATTGGVYGEIDGNTSIAANTIYHVAGVYDGAHLQVYVNGVADATPVAATGALANNNWSWGVGALIGQSAVSNPFNGWIDEPAVYGSALSVARLLAHYTAGS
jgi:hypothetical protein